MKTLRKILFTVIIAAITAFAVAACTSTPYVPDDNGIPGINANAAVEIEHDRLSFARGMTVDSAEVIASCGLSLTDDEGNRVEITADDLRSGKLSYNEFDVSEVGKDKRIDVTYNESTSYIFYDVYGYEINFYREKGGDLWKSVGASAELTDELELSVWVNISDYNFSTDAGERQRDEKKANRFNGWYDENDKPVTGINAMYTPTAGLERKLDLYAKFLTEAEAADLKLSYDGSGRRVFSGFAGGGSLDVLKVPEGVTYIDLSAIFPSGKTDESVNFSKLHVPSTAKFAFPLANGGANTSGLKEITVDSGSANYASYNGALYSKDYKRLYLMPAENKNVSFHELLTEFGSYSCAYWKIDWKTDGEIVLSDSVHTLDNRCFAYATDAKITGVENVENIMQGVFLGVIANSYEHIENGHLIALYDIISYNGDRTYNLSQLADRARVSYTVIPNTVSVSGKAFANCKSLESVDLGTQVESLGDGAFSGCSALKSVTIPPSVKAVGEDLFLECTALNSVSGLESFDFPNKKIPVSMFQECTNLKTIRLPSDITEIGTSAFYKSGITSIYFGDETPENKNVLPEGLTTIGGSAFRECGLTELKMPTTLTSLGSSAFSSSKLTSVDFSVCTNLTKLPTSCFQNNTVIESVKLPRQLKAISTQCFYNCKSLKSVEIFGDVTVGTGSFMGCLALDQSKIAWDKITSIGDRGFSQCNALVEISLPNVTTLGPRAFSSSASLERVHLGDKLTSVGSYPYTESTHTFTSGKSYSPFFTCNELKEITVDSGNPYFSSENGVLYGDYISDNADPVNHGKNSVLYCVPAKIEQTSLTIKNTVKIVLPYSVQAQTSLTSITLNEGIETIGMGAFYQTKSITSLVFPSTLEHLGSNVLLGSSITDISIAGSAALDNGNLVCKNGTVWFYLNKTPNVIIPDEIISISGGVFMSNDFIESIEIGDGVTEIGNKAFSDCVNLKSLKIGKNVNEIDPSAFANLKNLETITVDAENENFKAVNNVLYSKDGKKLILCAAKNGMTEDGFKIAVQGVEEICDYAFSYHATLDSVILTGSNVKTVGDYAFYECRKVTHFYSSDTLQRIGTYAFSFATPYTEENGENRYCDALRVVVLKKSIIDIGDNAFKGQFGIESVFFDMTRNEATKLTNPKTSTGYSGTNISYLTHGCKRPDGSYYNNVKRYLISVNEPQEFDDPDYDWFYFDHVNGEPTPWVVSGGRI